MNNNMVDKHVTDQAGTVRAGEELPMDALAPWLESNIEGLHGSPQVKQYSGGASNWTYCLDYPERSVILRRAPKGTKAKGAHDMGREYRLQRAIKPHFNAVPDMLALCSDNDIIGSEFYVMQKLNGIIPRKNMPKSLHLTESQTRQLCQNALDKLLQIHAVDPQALQNLAKGEGYVERQIEGWIKRYRNAKTWNVPRANHVCQWLQNNIPQRENICLTHNDFRFDNLVLDEQDPVHIIGVLDWELATLGDPLMDLGNALAYWVEAKDDRLAQATRRQPTHLKGMFSRAQVIDYYRQHSQYDFDSFAFYEVYGLFRLAGIVQQIYYRYHHKQTRNPAYKNIWLLVHYLMWRCRRVIKRG